MGVGAWMIDYVHRLGLA